MTLRAGRPAKTAVLQKRAAHENWQGCTLTWYDPALGGTNSSSGLPDPHSKTTSGEPYDPNKDTCAAPPNYPFGTWVTFKYGSKTVQCRVNDRGGAIQGNHFDLSRHAAETLGIINAGVVAASFLIGKIPGAPGGGSSGGPSVSGGGGLGGASPLTIITDLLTGNLEDLAVQMAVASISVLKDITFGVVDWIVIPFWQWNQRAVDYYYSQELLSGDSTKWEVLPWTAAFWSLGYYLLWTDPNSGNLKPAPVRNSRLARHVRTMQAIPARQRLIKPKDVKARTPTKPKPSVSRARVAEMGTMRASRSLPVRVSGEHVERIKLGTESPHESPRGKPSRSAESSDPARTESHANHRTGRGSLSDRGGNSPSDTRES